MSKEAKAKRTKSEAVSDDQVLPVSLRPRRLSEVVGQDTIVKTLRKLMATRPPRAIMFTGPSRAGKTTLARIIAVSAQCSHQKEWGEPCDACYDAFTSFDIHELNAAHANGVEEMGQIADLIHLAPMPPSRKRVVLLDEAHYLSKNAQNLLLKHTEEPPKHALWLMCTTDPRKLEATLKNRFATFQVKPLTIADREVLLKRAAKRVGITRELEPLIEAVHRAQLGAPGLLLMALELYGAGEAPERCVAGADAASVDTLAICRAVGKGDWVALKKAFNGASPEDARWVRTCVAGYLRGMLIRETVPSRAERIADCLIRLSAGTAPFEDALLNDWLWGTLCVVTRRLKG